MNECLPTPQLKNPIGYWMLDYDILNIYKIIKQSVKERRKYLETLPPASLYCIERSNRIYPKYNYNFNPVLEFNPDPNPNPNHKLTLIINLITILNLTRTLPKKIKIGRGQADNMPILI